MIAIHGIASCLGEEVPISSLHAEGLSREILVQLAVRGVSRFHRAERSLLELAEASARATLCAAKLAAEDIDVLLFASNSLRVEDHQLDISHCLLRALDLDRAYVHGICFQNCGDCILALRTAEGLVASGQARRVLIVFADRVCDAGVPRILRHAYIHSDGAASCVVERAAAGFAIGRSAIEHSAERRPNDPDDPDSLMNLDINLDRFAERARARFVDGSVVPFDRIITHNINRIFNHRLARLFGVPAEQVVGTEGLGHCLASDVLINLAALEDGARNVLVFTPTRRSFGVMALSRIAPEDRAHA